ncbi:MAG TPA: RNA-binding protein [Mucilaginibacter sp.]|jgi:RNA recognition motif-containing protein|nr:RNA-binding protein [Mucilaginibacter sp.]
MIKLFVVGFPREMDEMELAQLFAPYGDIKLLTIARDQIGGKSKGFGFIQIDDEGAKQAINALDGYNFGDRKLEVRIAGDKNQPAQKPLFNAGPRQPIKKKRPRISR